MTLDEIAIKHGCDKSSLKHDYCRIYEQYFQRLYKAESIHLFEIGYGIGASASMWDEYLPKDFLITIIDIEPKETILSISFHQCDAKSNEAALRASKADIIIDDGSHLNADIIAAFKNLWPVLNPGGLYCVEDVHSSYSDYYSDSVPFPDGFGTAMQFFTYISHSVNYDFIPDKLPPNDRPYYELYSDIEFIHFYKDLIILKKKAA